MAGRSRRPVTAADRRRQAEQREAKLAALHERLHTEVTALRSGENWTRWLDVARRFHTYSFRNTLLIAAQRPDATLVAGYDAWRQMGRQVDKGQKGIQILAPVTRPVDITAGDTAPASTADDAHAGAAATGAAPRRLVGFRLTHVWDITQTSGEPLPTPPRPTQLRGQAPAELWDTLAGLATERGFTVDRGDCSPANGLTNFPARTVTVRTDLDDAQAGKSLAHEVAHLLLHDPADFAGTTRGCRGTREVEAESVAYLVTGAAGLDSSGYTFPYVTHWASDVPGKTVEAVVADTGQRVLATSRSILDRYPPTSATVTAAVELPARVNAGRDRAAVIRTDADHATATATAPAPADGTPRSAAAVNSPQRLDEPAGALDTTAAATLHAAHLTAERFYRQQLADGWVPHYLDGRGLGAALRGDDLWGIGYAPDRWTALVDHLRASGFDDSAIEASGLGLRTRRNTLVDRFRERLMLPLRDEHANTIAFIGRAHPDAARTVPKYLNSPQTPLYRKGDRLYGLAEQALSLRAGTSRPVLVEGALDAIAVNLASEGRLSGLAPSGTALTAKQVDTLAGTVDLARTGVISAFDSDPAGRVAAGRAFELLRGQADTTQLHAVALPAGLDPADVLRRDGAAALTGLLSPDQLQPLADIAIDLRLDRWQTRLDHLEGRVHALRAVAPHIATLSPTDISRQVVRVAQRLDLDFATVTGEITAAVAVDGDAVGRLRAVDRRDDLDRAQLIQPPARRDAAPARPRHSTHLTPPAAARGAAGPRPTRPAPLEL